MTLRGEKVDLVAQENRLRFMEINHLYSIFQACANVTTDSRQIKGGELFFALKGENFDGNEYALSALEAGASHVVVSSDSNIATLANEYPDGHGGSRIIPVQDTLRALQCLATKHRQHLKQCGKLKSVIALTGTNGKTTTKELIRQVLFSSYKVVATEGNLNNSIGVPLSLLKVAEDTEIAVIEMGASHPGDIKELVDVALPDYGLITNVGKAHLLGFGSFQGVMATKGELYDYLKTSGGRIFINVNNPYLCRMASDRGLYITDAASTEVQDNAVRYGLDYYVAEVLPSSSDHPFLRLSIGPDSPISAQKETVETNLVGSYNADNVLAAISVGLHFDISLSTSLEAIASYQPSNNRSQMTVTERNSLVVDAYNANPSSMEAALDNFSNIQADKKIVFLGDMLELGEDSSSEHKKVIEKLMSLNLSTICLVGAEFSAALKEIGSPESILSFASSDALLSWIENSQISGATILIKGSRGTRMEKVIKAL